MERARKWMGELLLHIPLPFRSLREAPILGNLIHRLSHRILPMDAKVWARVEAGPARDIWLELNPRTGQSYIRGEAETAVQAILAERLRPGMVFYDLGANIGLFTLLAARLVGADGKVFSFEPDGETASRLCRNVTRNGFTNVTIVEAGVWSSSGKMRFAVADPSSPDRGVGKFVTGEKGESAIPTRCLALDDFIKDSPPPDAIKCDVEGAEVEVLRGAEQLLRTRHPWIICEMHSEASDRDTRELLRRHGYDLGALDVNHVLALPS